MNDPKLRFKEFNEEWHQLALQNLTFIIDGDRGKNYPKENEFYNREYCLFLNAGNVTKNGFDFSNNTFITKEKDDILRNGKLLKKDIVLTTRGTVGNVAYYDENISYQNIRINSGMVIIRVSNINISSRYLYSYMKSPQFNLQVTKSNFGSAQPQLTIKGLSKFTISYPLIKEQKKISLFINLLEKKIDLQSKKIEVLKLYKLSLREKLFYMFPTDNKKLSKILIKWNKKNKDNKYSYVESVSNKFGFIAQSEQFEDRNVASNDTSNYYIIEKGVFAYNPSRLNVGSLALKKNDKISLVSPLYECFTTNQNQDFMLEWFQSKEFRRGTFSKYEGGVRNTLNFNNLSSIGINLPSLESQNKIVKVLSCYNKLIDLELEKLNKLQQLKKGLMQQLFI